MLAVKIIQMMALADLFNLAGLGKGHPADQQIVEPRFDIAKRIPENGGGSSVLLCPGKNTFLQGGKKTVLFLFRLSYGIILMAKDQFIPCIVFCALFDQAISVQGGMGARQASSKRSRL